MEEFEELLRVELDKLPFEKHVDDGQYNAGQIVGFELGARWAYNSFSLYMLINAAIAEQKPNE